MPEPADPVQHELATRVRLMMAHRDRAAPMTDAELADATGYPEQYITLALSGGYVAAGTRMWAQLLDAVEMPPPSSTPGKTPFKVFAVRLVRLDNSDRPIGDNINVSGPCHVEFWTKRPDGGYGHFRAGGPEPEWVTAVKAEIADERFPISTDNGAPEVWVGSAHRSVFGHLSGEVSIDRGGIEVLDNPQAARELGQALIRMADHIESLEPEAGES